MKVEIIYICPTCKARYSDEKEAIKCKNKHQIQTNTFNCCEACGQGWNVNHFGLEQATKLAKECEQKHRDNGDYQEVKQRTLFLERRLSIM